jgi:WD40 repeat protein
VRSLQWRRAPETATTFAATPRTDWQVAALADGGTYLARAPEVRGDVRLIDWRTAAKPPIVFPGHESLSDIAVTPDGRHVATFDFDSVVRVYDRTVPDAPVSSFKVARSTFGQLAFLSDGRRLAVSGDGGSVRFYDWRHPKARTVSVGATKASDLVTAMAIAPGAQEVALAVSDSVVRLFHARPLGYSKTLIATQQGDLNALAFSRDARRLATGGDDGTVQVLNRRAPERPSIVLSAGRQAIDGVAFAPDGYHLASAGEDGSVKVFDWRTPNTPPLVLRSGGKPVDVVQFARDGHHVVSVSRDGVVQVADCQACGPLGDVMALARERLPRRPGAA